MKKFLVTGIVVYTAGGLFSFAMVWTDHPSGKAIAWITGFGFLIFCVRLLWNFLRHGPTWPEAKPDSDEAHP